MKIIIPSSDSDDDDELTWSEAASVYIGVKFVDDVQFIPIFNEMEWWMDYRDARCGHWVTDAARFRHRIRESEVLIGWIFSDLHIRRKRK